MYEVEYFPGEIRNVNEDSVYIRFMEKFNQSCKWTERTGETQYPSEDVKDQNPPSKCDSRNGLYEIKGINRIIMKEVFTW